MQELSHELTDVRIVTGAAPDDIHVVGLRLMEHALRNAGASVTSLGVLTPLEEFVEASQEVDAQAVFVSSSNGHAALTCQGLAEMLMESGLEHVLLYIGGNLHVGRPESWGSVEDQYRQLGFHRVYPPRTSPLQAIADLENDIVRSPS